MARKKDVKGIIEYAAEIVDRYDRWNQLNTYGGSDPFWSDGCNMDLVRNHILYAKRQLKDYCDNNNLELPCEYYFPTPQDVSRDYMARKDEIIEKAKSDYSLVLNDEDFKYLQGTYKLINDKKIREEAQTIVLRLEPDFNNLIALRRYNHSIEWDMNRLKEFMEKNRDSMLLGYSLDSHERHEEDPEDDHFDEEDEDYSYEEE